MSSMLMLIELILAIFLERATKKNSDNSSIPSSQTDKDNSSQYGLGLQAFVINLLACQMVAHNQLDTTFNSWPISCYEKASYILLWCVRLARTWNFQWICFMFTIKGLKVIIRISMGLFHCKIKFYQMKSNCYVSG
jgi:hypothetical protein